MPLRKALFFSRSASIFLIILALLSASLVSADDEVKWTKVPIPAAGKAGGWVLAPGSDVKHLTVAADGTLYAYAEDLTNTLYKSTNGGHTWAYLNNVRDDIAAIAIAPDNNATVYYATESAVYKSADGGKTFDTLAPNPGGAGSNNLEIASLAVARLTDNIIAVGIKDTAASEFGGVYILDEGETISTWQDTGLAGYDVDAVAFSPGYLADRQLIAVVTDETNSFVMSKIGEAGWQTIARLDRDNSSTPTPVVAESAAIVFPRDYNSADADSIFFISVDTGTDDGDVYLIEDSTATDLNIGTDYGVSNVDITGLAASGNSNSVSLMAGSASSAQVYFSIDGGESWTRSKKEPTGESATYVSMTPDFVTSGIAFTTTSGDDSAFSISRDGGTTWNQGGLIDTSIDSIIDFAPSPDYARDITLFLLTFSGEHSLWRSIDGIWERVFSSSLPDVASIDMVELLPQHSSKPVVFLAGSTDSRPAIWKSTDNGQNFTKRITVDPESDDAISITAWAAVSDLNLFIGSFDGSDGMVYETTNSGYFFSPGVSAGNQAPSSIVLSPVYAQDRTILVGEAGGWVYLTEDGGSSFEPLPPDASAPSLTGPVIVAFDSDFSKNRTVYANSTAIDEGIYRFIVGKSEAWERIDTTLPDGASINNLLVSADGTLYATDGLPNGGMERSLDPSYSLGPTFETITRGLPEGSTFTGLWCTGNRLWATESAAPTLMTFVDTLSKPVAAITPVDKASVSGTLVDNKVTNVTLDWETLPGATTYEWQVDYDTDFSSVPEGFEGTTRASSVRLPTLEPATTYYWRVRVSEPALSPWSAKRSFSTLLATQEAALNLEYPLPGAGGVSTRPVFQWGAVSGAERYELVVSSDSEFSSPVVARVGEFALPATAWQCNIILDYDTAYYWKVRALGAGTASDWSAASAFTTERKPAQADHVVSIPSVPTQAPVPQLPPLLTPAPLPPAPSQPAPLAPETPQWLMYVIVGLLITNVLLIITILALVVTIRRR